MMVSVILRPHRDESLLRFHPWVFSGAIAQIDGSPDEGDLVQVFSHDGRPLGCGHYQIGSIAVRILCFGDVLPGADFWTERIGAAFRMRCAFGLHGGAGTTCYRLVHGEGDGLPGLIIDWYDGVCVL
ncbi:MAG: class I SAM-dependent rRNA methyltransferase, partial [Bacteroidales bacterium]|nr:class I SAM-dependent rRNA methyltransferase [Bacteroidales bacterium]